MTFSIVARCQRTGQLGVAAVTGMPGVGTLLTWARRRTGAVATQGWINPYLGADALALLGHGHPARKALEAVVAMDDGRALRQLALVDRRGRTAAWTGPRCSARAGHLDGDGWVVAGNLLSSADTLKACAETFDRRADEPFVERLILGLEAGEAAGGDRRGARSATVYVVDTEEYPLWDVRVDDHARPLDELRRVQRLFAKELLPQVRKLPTREDALGQLSDATQEGLV